MMTLQHTLQRILVFSLAMLLLVACGQQESIVVYVTPTSEIVEIPSVTAAPPTSSPTDEVSPTVTALSPSETPTPVGDGRSLGSVIGPNYTPPPTNTPRPTTPPPTNTPAATSIPETPVATSIGQLPALNSEEMGIQLYYNMTIDQWWETMVRTDQLGVKWVKVQADWSWLQPDNPEQFGTSFSIFQSHVQRAYNSGFNVLVSITKAPDWARDTNVGDGPPSDPQLMVNFINFMLDKVGNQVNAIEIWNEPNLQREWNGGMPFNGEGYMRLFRPSYDAIRNFSPDIQIVTAGLAPTGENSAAGTRNDRAFLREMYAAGLAQYSDVHVGAHPYGWGNPPDTRCCNPIPDRSWDDEPQFFFLDTIEDYHEIMESNGHQTSLWLTEFGWATWSGIPTDAPEPWMLYNTPSQQREYTIRAFQIGQSLDYVGPMFLWNLNFANETLIQNQNEMVGYSLLVPGLPPRPLYEALQARP